LTPDLPFTIAEYQLRQAKARAVLQGSGLDGAIILAQDTQYWLTGYDTYLGSVLPQALILPAVDRPPALVVWDADVAIARQTSLVSDVRTYRFGVDEPADVIAAAAQDLAGSSATLGADLSHHTVSHAFATTLIGCLPGQPADIAADLAALRIVKSPAELDLIRRAGEYAEAGLEAARQALRPGMIERDLAAEIEDALRRSGSDYPSIPTNLAGGSRSVLGHGTPTDLALQAGDVVHIEIGGVERRYNSIGIQTLVVPGASPAPEAADLYQLARDCLRAGLDRLTPGVRAAEVEAPALTLIRQAG